MTQVNLSMKQRLTDIENRLVVARGRELGEGCRGRLGSAHVNFYI